MKPLIELIDGGFRAKVWAKSTAQGVTLTTVEATYPRFIHSEVKTHRALSGNSASSRAIPFEKMIANIESNPVVPIHWGKNQKGMQAFEELSPFEQDNARAWWLACKDEVVRRAKEGVSLGLHKQISNRILEPWMHMTTILSATLWENFFALRCHPDAEPHFQKVAGMLRTAIHSVDAKKLEVGQWHLPLVGADEVGEGAEWGDSEWVSAGRCARVSYLTHDGKRDPQADRDLAKKLATHKPAHASPLEHPALVVGVSSKNMDFGNFTYPFLQLRKTLATECVRG